MKKGKRLLVAILAIIVTAAMVTPMNVNATDSTTDYAAKIIHKDGTETFYEHVRKTSSNSGADAALQDGETLVLLKDVTDTWGPKIIAKDVTIDLNGFSILSNNNQTNVYAINIAQKYGSAAHNTVTIKNNTSKTSVLTSCGERIQASSGNSMYKVTIKLQGNIDFATTGTNPKDGNIKLGTGAKLAYSEVGVKAIANGGFKSTEADGEYIYGTYANAMAMDIDRTVELLNDYTGTDAISINQEGKKSVLDLNGHTFTTSAKKCVSVVSDGNDVTIKNGKLVSTGDDASGVGIYNYSNNKVTLENVDLEVQCENGWGIGGNGGDENNHITLTESTLKVPNGLGIYFPCTGSVTVDNSEIEAKLFGIQMCSGELNVVGDNTKITATGEPQQKTDNDGPILDGAAISNVNRTGYGNAPTLNIKAGTFVSKSGVEAVKAYSFNNTDKTEDEWVDAAENIDILGGSFSTAPKGEYINESVKTVVGLSGGDVSFAIGTSAEKAIQNAKEGDSITIYKSEPEIVVPAGVVVKNETGTPIEVNGEVVENNKEMTAEHRAVKVDAKDATCTADGNIEYWYCADCDKYFDSAELTNEITKEATVVEALGHNFKDGVCTVCKEKDPNYKEPTDNKGEEADKDKTDNDKTDKDSPKTGDDSNAVAMATLMLFAAAGATGTVAYGRRKNK